MRFAFVAALFCARVFPGERTQHRPARIIRPGLGAVLFVV